MWLRLHGGGVGRLGVSWGPLLSLQRAAFSLLTHALCSLCFLLLLEHLPFLIMPPPLWPHFNCNYSYKEHCLWSQGPLCTAIGFRIFQFIFMGKRYTFRVWVFNFDPFSWGWHCDTGQGRWSYEQRKATGILPPALALRCGLGRVNVACLWASQLMLGFKGFGIS